MACLQILTYTMFDFVIDYSTVDFLKTFSRKLKHYLSFLMQYVSNYQ